jgi:beta-glucan synthesis-associated protein KRE6
MTCKPSLISLFFQFSLSPDPASWGSDLSPNHAEPDDYLHNPDPRRDRKYDQGRNIFTYRGLSNLGCLVILILALIALLFVFLTWCELCSRAHIYSLYSAGYPIITFFTRHPLSRQGGFNFGGVNSTGQVKILVQYFLEFR